MYFNLPQLFVFLFDVLSVAVFVIRDRFVKKLISVINYSLICLSRISHVCLWLSLSLALFHFLSLSLSFSLSLSLSVCVCVCVCVERIFDSMFWWFIIVYVHKMLPFPPPSSLTVKIVIVATPKGRRSFCHALNNSSQPLSLRGVSPYTWFQSSGFKGSIVEAALDILIALANNLPDVDVARYWPFSTCV